MAPHHLLANVGAVTLLDAFEGRRMLIAYYLMWHAGRPAPEQCEGCTWVTSQVRELSYLHSRDVTYATFCQGPYEESARYRDFMGWEMPWYSAPENSLETLLVGRRVGMMHIVCYLRQGSKVFETYWTTRRGVEAMDNSYRLLDLTVYGRQETWEDSPAGWLKGKQFCRIDGRPTAQWSRVKAGYSDDLGTGRALTSAGLARQRGGCTMRYQIVSHEELLKPRREAWDNETCGEMISNTTHSVHAEVGQRREWPKASAGCLLSLAAAPTFAIMALLTGIQDGGMPGMLCSAAHDASPLTGMVPMYLLMGAFHLAPWLRLITNWRSGARLC